MTGKSERSILAAKLMAAASVLGLSLGMGTADAEQANNGQPQGQTATQHKGVSDQHKLTTGFLKHNNDAGLQSKHVTGQGSDQLKYEGVSGQHKLSTEFLKHNTGQTQIKGETGQGSNQLKYEGVSGQHKHQTPSTQLNPQPEPPKPAGAGTPQNH